MGVAEGYEIVVVYLKTNQRQLGYLSSGNGHLAGRYSTPRFKRADAIGCSATPYSPHFGTSALELQRH